MNKPLALIAATAVLLLGGLSTGCKKLEARDNLNKGVNAFKNAKYPEEAAKFLMFFFKEENYIKYLHTVPIHLLPTLKSVRNNPAYQANEMVRKWKEWQDMQYRYFDSGQAKPTLIVEWDDLKLPFGLEILASGIVPDMVTDANRGMSSAQAAAKAQARAEELIAKLGYKRW